MRLAAIRKGTEVVWGEVDEANSHVRMLATGTTPPWASGGATLTTQAEVSLSDAILTAPVHGTRQIIAIGLNYVDHAAESAAKMPAEPLVFAKLPNSLLGPGGTIRWDSSITNAVDYEAELAVVLARTCRRVAERDALDFVLGYTCLNDVSARDLQFLDGQWIRGKSLDTFCPVGPYLVTADEIPDPQALEISCTVSGEVLQQANTLDMYFGVAELISYLSRMFTLEAGDVIATGTPPGVGYFRDPQRLLGDGDVVTVSIGGVGELTNPVHVDGRA